MTGTQTYREIQQDSSKNKSMARLKVDVASSRVKIELNFKHVACWPIFCGNDYLCWKYKQTGVCSFYGPGCFQRMEVLSHRRGGRYLPRSSTVSVVTVGGSRVSWARHSSASAHTNARKGLVDAHGQGCYCYDAMATAPWEACEELNEFAPQLKWSSRRQWAHDTERAAQGLSASTATQTGPRPRTLHANTRPGVHASPAASRVMTPGKISLTSVRRCSNTGEAVTPCSPSLAHANWGGIVFNPVLTCLHLSSFFFLTCHSADLFGVLTGPPWLKEPPPGC